MSRQTIKVESVMKTIHHIRSHYSEEIFPPPKEGETPTQDQLSAKMGRLVCDNLKELIELQAS